MHNPLLNSFPYSYSLLVPFQSFLFNNSSNGTNYKRIRYISTLFLFLLHIVQFTFQDEHTISLNKDFLKSHPNTLFSTVYFDELSTITTPSFYIDFPSSHCEILFDILNHKITNVFDLNIDEFCEALRMIDIFFPNCNELNDELNKLMSNYVYSIPIVEI